MASPSRGSEENASCHAARKHCLAHITDRTVLRVDCERKEPGNAATRRNTGEREWHAACFCSDVIERLNSLLRAELASVAGYQKALRALKKKAAGDTEHILQLASEHQRTVTVLQGSVQARGGEPVLAAEPWEGSGVAVLTVVGSPARLEDRRFVGALLEVERRGLAEYEAALTSLDEDARELVEIELIPRQQRHVAALSALLVSLAA